MTDGADANDVPLLDQILSGFSVAEVAAEEVVELILREGGRQLYQAYIERKSFAFASEAFSKLLISELEMCFVCHDEGEPNATSRSRCSSKGQTTLVVPELPVAKAVSEAVVEQPTEAPPATGAVDISSSSSAAPDGAAAEVAEALVVPGAVAAAEPPPPGPGFGNVWTLEAEPKRCRIDTWARACVPVRRKLVRPKSRAVDEQKKKTGRAPKLSTQSVSSRSPSRMLQSVPGAMAAELQDLGGAKVEKTRPQMIPLVEHVEHDEEESALRDMKDREAKRRRDEENRLQRKAADEAEEAARLAQVKDQMKNKPYTYDSQGNIIWVQALQAEKLPTSTPAPTFTLRRETAFPDESPRDRKAAHSGRSRDEKKLGKARTLKDPEFVDTFKKFASQQPAMMEAMTMAPGVQLSERGATKQGGDSAEIAKQEKRLMTRRDYEEMVQSGKPAGYPDEKRPPSSTPGNATPAGDAGSQAGTGAYSKTASMQELNPAEGGTQPSPTSHRGSRSLGPGEMGTHRGEVATGVMKVVRSMDLDIVPHPPLSARPEQPMPPPSARRVQMKRDALGYALSTRERIPTGTGSRFPNCAAQPPLGATMGHGLVAQGQKHEEYYFPVMGIPGIAGSDLGEDVASIAPSGVPSVLPSPRSLAERAERASEREERRQGQIVSKNPELVKRLFQR